MEAMAKLDASAAHPCMLGAIADIADAGPITRPRYYFTQARLPDYSFYVM